MRKLAMPQNHDLGSGGETPNGGICTSSRHGRWREVLAGQDRCTII